MDDFPYVFLDGRWLKRSRGGEVKNLSVLVVIGVAQTGYREILSVSEGAKEDGSSWTVFLHELKRSGIQSVELFVSGKCLGLVENLAEFYQEVKWQRCVVHFYRNLWTAVPTSKVKEVAAMLKAIHAQEDAHGHNLAPLGTQKPRNLGPACTPAHLRENNLGLPYCLHNSGIQPFPQCEGHARHKQRPNRSLLY